ncbi:MAG: NUDIX domain-containing protein [Candidatus Thorarchaeota archaeon]|jgi:ADP-ribose pyrophosphatase YjhB (NUDIX family)
MVFPSIRPKAFCIIRNGARLLLEYSKWPTEQDVFYVPLGGQIKYGEYGEETIRREIKEEIQADIENIRYLGSIENIFEVQDDIGHEIVLVYEADFVDKSFYEKEVIEGLETEIDPPLSMVVYWKSIQEIEEEGVPLYPELLKELLGE